MAMEEAPVAEQQPSASASPMLVTSESTSNSTTAETSRPDQVLNGSSDQRSSIASCKACDTNFATLYNGWHQITGSYYLPTLHGSYRITGLRAKSKPKLAAETSSLHGCTIQPLVCNNCDDTLAIVCIKAPEGKSAYAEREFFKLPKIQLRSETSGKPVDAIIEGDHQATSPHHPTTEAANMERSGEVAVTTVQKPSLPSMSVLGHKPSEDARRNDLPSVRTVPSQPLQPKPAMTEREVHPPPQPRLAERGPTSMNVSINGQPHATSPSAVPSYPSSLAVKLDAVDRIQTQVNLNRATLESCTRDITRLEGSVRQLHVEFKDTLDAIRMELLASRQQAAIAHPERLDDKTLEVFSTTLSQAVSKANEVDVLRVQFEVIKRRLQRLEESNTSPTATASEYLPTVRQPSLQHMGAVHHTVPAQRQLPSSEGRVLASQPAQLVAYTAESAHHPHRAEPDQAVAAAAAGWVPVNTGMKRGASSGVDGHGDAATPIGSPKRAKLAPLEPRYAYEAQAGSAAPTRYERMDTDEPVATPVGYRTASHDSYADTTNPSTFVPHTQDGGPDENWRASSQRVVSGPAGTSISPRGRGRGRGRGGRPRKSMPLEPHLTSTPEWEKEGWTGSQVETDGFYRGSVNRRGSGGVPAMIPSPVQAFDPYGHTKRSRTKPIRNADGILIRKDGRPDMRSQSSANNLRKVHAKKEEEKREAATGGTTSSLAGESVTIAESPASTDSHDVEPSTTQERSAHIMSQMFPKGQERERARLYTAQQYFASEPSQAGTAASTPVQRTATESDHEESVEPEKARDDTPQQRDETMEDASAETGSPKSDAAPSASSHTKQNEGATASASSEVPGATIASAAPSGPSKS